MLPMNSKDKYQKRKAGAFSCANVSWILLAVLALLLGAAFWYLQDAYREIGSLKLSALAAEEKALKLTQEVDVQKQRAAQALMKGDALRKEKEDASARLTESESSLALAKKESQKLRETQEANFSAVQSLNKKLAAAEQQFIAAESERKEATRKAGLCEQRYASLNAECATLKQGLAKLGVTQESVQPTETEAGLDPRGGMEAAKVLKDHNQLPWQAPPIGAGEDSDETGPGLEKPQELR